MEQKDIVLKVFFGAVDAVDIVGVRIFRIFYKGVPKRQIQTLAVVYQNAVEKPGGHDNLFDSCGGQHSQLS